MSENPEDYDVLQDIHKQIMGVWEQTGVRWPTAIEYDDDGEPVIREALSRLARMFGDRISLNLDNAMIEGVRLRRASSPLPIGVHVLVVQTLMETPEPTWLNPRPWDSEL